MNDDPSRVAQKVAEAFKTLAKTGAAIAPSTAPHEPAQPEAPLWSTTCGHCGKTTAHPLGTLDPKQGSCGHVLVLDGYGESLRCTGCSLVVGREVLAAAGYVVAGSKYDTRAQTLADANTKLRAENLEVLAENARLRRALERAKVPVPPAPPQVTEGYKRGLAVLEEAAAKR